MKFRFALMGAMLLWAVSATAQTVINPNIIQFTVSADHAVQVPGAGALVERYEVRWYAVGASAPVSTSDLGKPAPDAQGVAIVDITQTIVAFPIDPVTQYVARVVALGVAGPSQESAPSGPFSRAAPPAVVGNVTLIRR